SARHRSGRGILQRFDSPPLGRLPYFLTPMNVKCPVMSLPTPAMMALYFDNGASMMFSTRPLTVKEPVRAQCDSMARLPAVMAIFVPSSRKQKLDLVATLPLALTVIKQRLHKISCPATPVLKARPVTGASLCCTPACAELLVRAADNANTLRIVAVRFKTHPLQ